VSEPEATKFLGGDNAADETTVNIGAASAAAQAAADAEAERRAEEARIRQEERAARERALGKVPPTADDVALPPPERDRNDRFIPSIGLFLLRIALAAILGVRGVQVLFNIDATTAWLTDHHVPQADVVVWALAFVLLVIALMLVFGLGTRAAGLLTAAMAIALLVFVRWGYSSVFVDGQAGFTGDWDALVAAIGIALLCLGSGGWAIDAAMRYSRAKRKLYQ